MVAGGHDDIIAIITIAAVGRRRRCDTINNSPSAHEFKAGLDPVRSLSPAHRNIFENGFLSRIRSSDLAK